MQKVKRFMKKAKASRPYPSETTEGPLVVKWAKGSKLYDADGREFIDFCLSRGDLILGHAHRNVILSVKKYAERGISFGTASWAETELAQTLIEAVPSLDAVRFVHSRTEAVMNTIRLAQQFTGRTKIVSFEGYALADGDQVIRCPFNDIVRTEAAITSCFQEIACVIIEPVTVTQGVVAAGQEFLQGLRRLTRQYGIVLIFDESLTGFRSQKGCAQSEFGIIPDMTCLEKIIGGGLPAGAYGGRQDIMNGGAPNGGVHAGGILAGAPVILRAGLMTLRLLNEAFYAALNSKADEFQRRMNGIFEKKALAVRLEAFHSMMALRFFDEPAGGAGQRYGRLAAHLLSRGIYFPPEAQEPFFICGAHTKKDLDRLREEIEAFFVKGD